MQHDGEAGQTLGDFLEHVEAQRGRNENALFVHGALLGLELVSAVARADGDGEGIAAGLGNEFLNLLGAGVGRLMRGDLDLILDAGERAEFGLDHNAVVVRVFDDLLRDLNVLGEGLGGGVDHHGGEAAVDAGLAGLKVRAVVKVQHDGDVRAALDCGLHELNEVGVVCIGARALADLQDHGRVLFLTGLGDTLHDLHVVDVERADGVSAVIGLFEHFGRCYERHNIFSFLKI